MDYKLPERGNNELTMLAETINYLSQTQKSIREKEQRLQAEKEELIRSLSHDIRTPLTAILSYTELMAADQNRSPQERADYYALVKDKALQIKGLSQILLDGGQRNPAFFEDARLLMEQLAGEMEAVLEDTHKIRTDLSACPAFSGWFDVGELRRITDNLISNIQKYADPSVEAELEIRMADGGLLIRQKNAVLQMTQPMESYHMGLSSIRRIAQNYDGTVEVNKNETIFEIRITLSKI